MDKSDVEVWMPSDNDEQRIDVGEAATMGVEIKIEKPRTVVERLKNTAFGQFYSKHLKKNRHIHWLVLWLWKNGYPVYANIRARLIGGEAGKWRRLTSYKKYILEHGIIIRVVAPQELVETPSPRVFPSEEQSFLVSPHSSYTYPELYIFIPSSDAVVCGGTNLVLVDNKVLHHDLYDFSHDYLSEELHVRVILNKSLRKVRWLLYDPAPEVIPVAASFLDSCAANYAHWMTEVLPRIAIFCMDEAYKDIPILVNDGLHRNLIESLTIVAGSARKVIMVPFGKSLKVSKLYLTSAAGYVPFERRNNGLNEHSHGLFSPFAFGLLRASSDVFADSVEGDWPDKIILRRKTGVRRVKNFADLESALVPKGFKVVETERLTFIQQVVLFSRAKIIIGSSGAAFASLMFAPKDAKIFILISKFPNTSYWYWQNIACSSGKKINYVLGSVEPGGNSIHADFSIDLEKLLSELDAEIPA